MFVGIEHELVVNEFRHVIQFALVVHDDDLARFDQLEVVRDEVETRQFRLRVDARARAQVLEETLHRFQGFAQFVRIQVVLIADLGQLSQNVTVEHRLRVGLRAELQEELFGLVKFSIEREDERRNLIADR